MRRIARSGPSLVIAAAIAVGGAAVASAAVPGPYKGKTSQKQPVTFRLSSGQVKDFKAIINDRCPDGHTLKVTGHYPPMPVKRGKFGGQFVPIGGHPGEQATLRGAVGGRKVTGRVNDTSFSNREGVLCHGSATFAATHR